MKSNFVFAPSLSLAARLACRGTPAARRARDALVAGIVAQNPEIAFYAADIAAAEAGLRTGGASPVPSFRSMPVASAVHDSPARSPAKASRGPSRSRRPSSGRGRALRKAIANREVELAELGLARFQRALAARARTLAYGLRRPTRKAAAVREVADRFHDLKEKSLAREPAGITPQLETRVIEASESRSSAARPPASLCRPRSSSSTSPRRRRGCAARASPPRPDVQRCSADRRASRRPRASRISTSR